MKLLIIGLGSMGSRRTRLITKNFPDFQLCGCDNNPKRRNQIKEQYQINVYEDVCSAIEKEQPDAALVCTPPESHGVIILECVGRGLHVFSEINLILDRYNEIINMAKERDTVLFLSSTLLYRREIEIIRGIVAEQKTRVNYRYHVGQYLPDWHPWDDREEFFVWNKKTNGCREIFAIDLPWIIKTFGSVERLIVMKGSLSKLDIDYPDHYIVMLEHQNGTKGVFFADVVCRTAVRELLVYSEDLHVTWNGTPDGLLHYHEEKKRMEKLDVYNEIKKDPRYADSIIENAYQDELQVFFDKITGRGNLERHTFEEDREILKLIDRIEGA